MSELASTRLIAEFFRFGALFAIINPYGLAFIFFDKTMRFTNDLRMRCYTKRAQVTQDQGRSQSYDHYPHALASLPHTT